METPIRIFVADDHQIFRQGLLKLLETEKSINIIGESGDGLDALQMIKERRPDIAILDISMPGMNGLEIVTQIKTEKLPLEFIILTMYDDEEYFNQALDYGVKGYLLKDNAIVDLLACVKFVAQGKYYVSPLISEYLLHREEKIKILRREHPGLDKLTTMEKSILRLIAENITSKEIAEQLFISYRTVENHRQHICDKLGLKGYHKLLQLAIENKLFL